MKPFSKEHIAILLEKFNALADQYLSEDIICNNHIELKREHTLMVCKEIQSLADEIGFSPEETRLAYVIALFHDIGRFEQFYRYRTFDDSRSLNHAALSVDIIKSDGLTEHIPDAYREIICRTIINHNIPVYQAEDTDEVDRYTKLLRDADKLDILRVVTHKELRRLLEWKEQTDHYEVPDIIYRRFQDHRLVTLDLVRSLNDIRLVRIGWIFDINHGVTFKKIRNRKLLDKIFDLIPGSERMDQIKAIVRDFLNDKIPA